MPQVMDNKTNNRLNTSLNELPEQNSYLRSSLKNELSMCICGAVYTLMNDAGRSCALTFV